MKKRILRAISIVVMLIFLIPEKADACWGFIAVNGERIFHSVYCDDLEGASIENLLWFGTAKEAENYGLNMCEKCAELHDYDFDQEYCYAYFKTNNPLILTAMELSREAGFELGKENGYEESSSDFDNYYESGYEEGFERGKAYAYEEVMREVENEKNGADKMHQTGKLASLCLFVPFIFCFAFLADLLGAAWAAFRKREYKSKIGEFVSSVSERDNAWGPLLVAAAFSYGLFLIMTW